MKKIQKILLIILLILIPGTFASLVFPREVVFFDKLVPNDEQTKLINNENILFTKFSITANTNISRARITIQAMPDCPENAPYQENVLQCFYISGFEFNDEQVLSTKISFKVPKEWIEINDYEGIELRRYSYSWNENIHGILSNWKSLTTKLEIKLENESKTFNQYVAVSDGINYFSIVGVNKEIIIPKLKDAAIPKITADAIRIIPKKNEAKNGIKAEIKNTENNNPAWLPALFLFLAMGLIIFTSKLEKETQFEQLTDYIKNSSESEQRTKCVLKSNGWEDWQIKLAIDEAKKHN